MKKNQIKDSSIELSLFSIQLFKQMNLQKEFILSKQLLRCSTGIGANIHEAFAAESKKDFVHKLSISLKEAREAEYWIAIIDQSKIVDLKTNDFRDSLNSVISLLVSIIKTSKKNLNIPLY